VRGWSRPHRALLCGGRAFRQAPATGVRCAVRSARTAARLIAAEHVVAADLLAGARSPADEAAPASADGTASSDAARLQCLVRRAINRSSARVFLIEGSVRAYMRTQASAPKRTRTRVGAVRRSAL
jgi:hypothetical protein